MKLRDILSSKPIKTIEVRANSPLTDEKDMLFGFCSWDGERLISLDGDNYDVDDEIVKYEFDEKGDLTYWIHCFWRF